MNLVISMKISDRGCIDYENHNFSMNENLVNNK